MVENSTPAYGVGHVGWGVPNSAQLNVRVDLLRRDVIHAKRPTRPQHALHFVEDSSLGGECGVWCCVVWWGVMACINSWVWWDDMRTYFLRSHPTYRAAEASVARPFVFDVV